MGAYWGSTSFLVLRRKYAVVPASITSLAKKRTMIAINNHDKSAEVRLYIPNIVA